MIDTSSLDAELRSLLDRFGFDQVPFTELACQLTDNGFDPGSCLITDRVELPPPGMVELLPTPGSPEAVRLTDLGRRAIDAGQVGVVVLNGGMATRFGGRTKGVVEAWNDRSFLDLKLSQVALAGESRTPVLLMNSFATADETIAHLADLHPRQEVRCFNQLISLRLTPAGELFYDADDQPSPHAPGHGDLLPALRISGELDRFVAGGGRWLTLSNVDNLGATLDPLIIGLHVDRGRPMSVEVVKRIDGDVGGFPALINGRPAIVEAFRAPGDFDLETVDVFNTNTFVFDAATLAGDFPLRWFSVLKTVDGRSAIQFERLVGQLTEMVDVTWISVPRRGPTSRFLPIKVPGDLRRLEVEIEMVLRASGVLTGQPWA